MLHLMNCHGEWAFALAALVNAPLLGMWARGRLAAHRHKQD
jgi:hypothetical protein